MHGPTCIFWSNLTPFSLQALLTYDNLTKPGAYNDPDMLTICNGGQSDAEYRAQFSLWSILTAPLILGNDLRNISESCAAIILNKEVIAVRQALAPSNPAMPETFSEI
jgi:alpha-galactosidase